MATAFTEVIEAWFPANIPVSDPPFHDSPAIGFAFLVQLLESHDQEMAVTTTLSTLAATRQLLEETGVQELVYVDFYDQIVQLVQNIIVPDEKKTVLTLDGLLNFFRDTQGKCVLE